MRPDDRFELKDERWQRMIHGISGILAPIPQQTDSFHCFLFHTLFRWYNRTAAHPPRVRRYDTKGLMVLWWFFKFIFLHLGYSPARIFHKQFSPSIQSEWAFALFYFSPPGGCQFVSRDSLCFVKNELQQMDFMMMKISQFFIFRLRIVNFRYCCSFKLLLLLSTVSFPVIRTLNGILLFDWIRCEIEMNWAFGRGVALGRWSWMNAEWWNTMAVCLHFISFLTHSGC